MVLWGATFNAVVVVGVVSLLLFRLPMAILCNTTAFCHQMVQYVVLKQDATKLKTYSQQAGFNV